jgi:S1-C subfamily serine protease
MDEVISAINSKQPGDELQLTILRGKDQSEITATLTERPSGSG